MEFNGDRMFQEFEHFFNKCVEIGFLTVESLDKDKTLDMFRTHYREGFGISDDSVFKHLEDFWNYMVEKVFSA